MHGGCIDTGASAAAGGAVRHLRPRVPRHRAFKGRPRTARYLHTHPAHATCAHTSERRHATPPVVAARAPHRRARRQRVRGSNVGRIKEVVAPARGTAEALNCARSWSFNARVHRGAGGQGAARTGDLHAAPGRVGLGAVRPVPRVVRRYGDHFQAACAARQERDVARGAAPAAARTHARTHPRTWTCTCC